MRVNGLRSHLQSIEQKLAEVCKADEVRVDEYCGQLRAEVTASVEAVVRRVRQLEEDMLGEIEEYRVGCLRRLGDDEGNTGIIREEKMGIEVEEPRMFCEKWKSYLKLDNDQVTIKPCMGSHAWDNT